MLRGALVWAGAAWALLTAGTAAAAPVVALLDPDKSDRVGLLEAKLLTDAGLTLVERSAVDRVLKEQELQSLFAPRGVGERARLGAILKADVLVLVRTAKAAKEPALELAVCETAGGLRLLARPVPLGADATADAAVLEALVKVALAKAATPARAVVAVPPFVSRDLLFDTDHLKAALAKVAEQAAADQAGVVAVELAEAEAIADELRLAAPGSGVRRAAPLYLLGEYRHEGTGAGRRVSLTLRAERGGKAELEPMTFTVTASEASVEVRNWSAALASMMADGVPAAAAEPKVEAAQLAQRATAFRRLGDWPEALALAEASLLLDPDQSDMRAVAIKGLSASVTHAFQDATSEKPGGMDRLEQLYLRGLVHVEALALSGDMDNYHAMGWTPFDDLRAAISHFTVSGRPAVETLARLEAIREQQRAMSIRIIPTVRKQKGEWRYVSLAVEKLPLAQKYEKLSIYAAALVGQPDARQRVVGYARGGYLYPPDADAPEFRMFVEQLAKSADQELRAAAIDLERLAVASRTAPLSKSSNIDTPIATTPGPEGIQLSPVTLAGTPASGVSGGPFPWSGIIPAGPGVDALWAPWAQVYLMKKRGEVRLVWKADLNDGVFGPTSVSFDGRFLWVTLHRGGRVPGLMVIDPITEKTWDLSLAEGLPWPAGRQDWSHHSAKLMATPLAPGLACAAGTSFGRAWVAVVSFDPNLGRGTAKVIHEAREAPDGRNHEQWRDTTVAFAPQMMYTLRGKPGPDGRIPRRVVIGREAGENYHLREHPLVIDPDAPEVSVLSDRIWNLPEQYRCAAGDGAVYFTEFQLTQDRRLHIVRLAFPGTTKEVIASGLATCDWPLLAFHANRLHASLQQSTSETLSRKKVLTPENFRSTRVDQWWSADADGKNLRQVATGLPDINALGSSQHYGLVAFIGGTNGYGGQLHTVEFPDVPARK